MLVEETTHLGHKFFWGNRSSFCSLVLTKPFVVIFFLPRRIYFLSEAANFQFQDECLMSSRGSFFGVFSLDNGGSCKGCCRFAIFSLVLRVQEAGEGRVHFFSAS